MKPYLTLLMMMLLACYAQGATVHGKVYNLDLEPVDAIVEINTQPRQQIVAVNGDYSFDIPIGFYTLTAKEIEQNETLSSVYENLLVIDDGDYVLDLILFPEFDFDYDDIGTDLDEIAAEEGPDWHYLIPVLMALVLMLSLIYVKRLKRLQKETDEADIEPVEERIMLLLKKNGGRMTQKEIRREIPLSEAKISLVIADLESKGRLKKIKKGRGNIIALQ
ncbi:hypothetical protein JW968_03780 [Candidatus Woesearchaeota archaeon]|nr:hypothetical protein [Candidatus Woesearchaeota archaeon]